MTSKQVIEALVFASPKPLLTKEIVAALRAAGQATEDQEARDYATLQEPDVAALLEEIKSDYAHAGRPFLLAEQVNGWTLITDPSAARWVRQLYPEAKPTRLSGPALETLAIIAYRQPITRADIEAVRGVAVDGVMQVLLERGLVKIAGRTEMPGRPLLYSTTEYFLQHFGLKTVEDLPNSGELRRIPLPTAPAEEVAKPKKRKKGDEPPAAETAATSEGGGTGPEAPAENGASQTEAAVQEVQTDTSSEESAPASAEAEVAAATAPPPDSVPEPSE